MPLQDSKITFPETSWKRRKKRRLPLLIWISQRLPRKVTKRANQRRKNIARLDFIRIKNLCSFKIITKKENGHATPQVAWFTRSTQQTQCSLHSYDWFITPKDTKQNHHREKEHAKFWKPGANFQGFSPSGVTGCAWFSLK